MKWPIDFGDRPWRPWFAWFPVRPDGTDIKVWWEWVERRTYNAQGYRIHRYRVPLPAPPVASPASPEGE